MRRLIDNTHLHCVARCLQGNARDLGDVNSYMRFLGDVLCTDQLVYTAVRGGPVYPVSAEAVLQIYKIGGQVDFIKYFDTDAVDYCGICDLAARDAATEIAFISSIVGSEQASFQPHFNSGEQNPDVRLHDFISQGKSIPEGELTELSGKASNASGYILSRPQVFRQVGLLRRRQPVWSLNETIALAATIRKLVYSRLGTAVSAEYMPDLGRAMLNVGLLPVEPNPITAFIKATEEQLGREALPELTDIMNAILVLSNGDPCAMLAMAFEFRRETENIRGMFSAIKAKFPSEAHYLRTKQLAAELRSALHSLTGKSEAPSLILCFEPVLVLFTIPTVSVKVEEIGKWLQFKRRAKHLRGLSRLILKAENCPASESKNRFLTRCGITNWTGIN